MALKASEFAPEDFISTMPDNVITSILHRIPLQDAVRTSILSRSWRFKWTMLSELKFDDSFFVYLRKTKDINCLGKILSTLLAYFNGAITKTVFVPVLLDVEDIHHLISFLSRKGIKDLTITDWAKPEVKLPTHLFSCLELTRLNIYGFCFTPPPGFRGFTNLLSLELRGGQYGGSDLGDFLTRCPLLETLDLGLLSYSGTMKLNEIAKLENLKVLSISLSQLETTNALELVGCLPNLKELGLDFQDCQLTEGDARTRLSTAFPRLRALNLTRIDFGNGIVLSFVLEMIRHFPNLQTLDIIANRHVADPFPNSIPILDVNYNMMELRSVLFRNFKGLDNEIYLIKYILERSPSLKEITIQLNARLEPFEQLFYARRLLKLHRASPVAEIDFY